MNGLVEVGIICRLILYELLIKTIEVIMLLWKI